MIFGNFSDWTLQNVIIRILAASILGMIIGLDRGIKHRGAGTKTNTIVCLGAALVMLIEQYIQVNYPGLANMDRLGAQVISGVGFLGVGTIIVSNHQVRGLTTAATLWACACVGLACGIGFIDGGVLITGMMLIALHALPFAERFVTRNIKHFSILFEVKHPSQIHDIIKLIKQSKLEIDSLEIMKSEVQGAPTGVYMTLCSRSAMTADDLSCLLTARDEIVSIDII